MLALVKVLFVLLVSASLAGQFLVGSYTWGYDGKWVQAKTYWPVCGVLYVYLRWRLTWTTHTQATQKLFTETQLAQYDGKDPTKPIYLAVRVAGQHSIRMASSNNFLIQIG